MLIIQDSYIITYMYGMYSQVVSYYYIYTLLYQLGDGSEHKYSN